MKVTSSSFKRAQSASRTTEVPEAAGPFCAQLCTGGFRVSDMKHTQTISRNISEVNASERLTERWVNGSTSSKEGSRHFKLLQDNASVISQYNQTEHLSKLSFNSNCSRQTNSKLKSAEGSDCLEVSRSSLFKEGRPRCFEKTQTGWHKEPLQNTSSAKNNCSSEKDDKENTPMDLIGSHLSQISSISGGLNFAVADVVTPRLGDAPSGTTERSVDELESQLRIFKDIWQLNEEKRKAVYGQFEREHRLLKKHLIDCRALLTAKEVSINELQTKCRLYQKELHSLRQQLRSNASGNRCETPHKLLGSDCSSIVEDNLAKAISAQLESRVVGMQEEQNYQMSRLQTNQRKLAEQLAEVHSKLNKQLDVNANLSLENDKFKDSNEVLARAKRVLEERLEKNDSFRALALRLESALKLVVDLVIRSDCQCCETAKLLIRHVKLIEQPLSLQGSIDFNLSDVSERDSAR